MTNLNRALLLVSMVLQCSCAGPYKAAVRRDATLPNATTDNQLNRCGNGIVEPSEECDTFAFDGLTCVDFGYFSGSLSCSSTCTVNTSLCRMAPECGNGVVETGEQCDDGNWITDDDCPDGPNGICMSAYCGDGFVWFGQEGCDVADDPNCLPDCSGYCGNGMVDQGERCDGGDCYDDCSGSCGDGLLHDGSQYPDHGEECDPGSNTHDCTVECTITYCGDGHCTASEQTSCSADCGCGPLTACGVDCCEGMLPNTPGQCCGASDCVVWTNMVPLGIQNCGSCGNDCVVGEVCTVGACTTS